MNANEQAKQDAITNAQLRVKEARQALIDAGDALLKALEATDDEIEQAKEALCDMFDDERGSSAVADGPEWAAMLADQVGQQREWDEADQTELDSTDPDLGPGGRLAPEQNS